MVDCQLLTMTDQSNMSYYDNKQDHSKSSHTDRLDICECQLVCLHLDDLAYYHNKTYLIDQSLSAAGNPPCTISNTYLTSLPGLIMDMDGVIMVSPLSFTPIW